MNIQDVFKQLCSDPDFIEVYNDQTGEEVTKLTTGQLFSTGTLFHMIEVTLADHNILRLTDAYFDIDYQGQTYLATGDFLDISQITDEKEINNNGLNIRVSNVRKEYITLIQNKMFEKAKVKITMAFLNPNTGAVATTYQVFSGEVDCTTINIEYDEDKLKNESEFTVNSIWAALEKTARCHASDGIHRSYPGNENDLFFNKIGKWNSEAFWRTAD